MTKYPKYSSKSDKILYELELNPWGLSTRYLMAKIKHSATSEFYKNMQKAWQTAARQGYLIEYKPGKPQPGQVGRAPGLYVLTRYKRT